MESRAHIAEMQAKWAPSALKARLEEERRKAAEQVAAVKAKQGLKDADGGEAGGSGPGPGLGPGAEASGGVGQVGVPPSGPRGVRAPHPPGETQGGAAAAGHNHLQPPGSARGRVVDRRTSGAPAGEAGRLGTGERAFRVRRTSSENRAAELQATAAAVAMPRRATASRLSHGYGGDQAAERGPAAAGVAGPTLRSASPGANPAGPGAACAASAAFAAGPAAAARDGGKGGHSVRESLRQVEERRIVSCPALQPIDQGAGPTLAAHSIVSPSSHAAAPHAPATLTLSMQQQQAQQVRVALAPHAPHVRHSVDALASAASGSSPPLPSPSPSGKPPPHPMRASAVAVPHRPPVHPSTREAWGSPSPGAGSPDSGAASDGAYGRSSPQYPPHRASITMPIHHASEQHQQPQPATGMVSKGTSPGLRALLAATSPSAALVPSGRFSLGAGPSPGKGLQLPATGRKSETDAMNLPIPGQMFLSTSEQAEIAMLYGKERRVTLTG